MLLLLTSLALAAGFRYDGTGHTTAAPVPAPEARWRLELPATGNASVIGFGADVCFTSEPTTLRCVNAETGAPHWEASHDVVDAIGADDATRREILSAATAQAALESMRAEVGPLKKRIRAGDANARSGLELLEGRIRAQEALIAAHADKLTPPSDPHMGWASPTPITDGAHIWAVFANGVVACHSADGALVWQRWLGPRTTTMEFYPGLPTASPALAGGLLLVGYNQLQALDPATGEARWTGPTWDHYGSPVAMDVGGLSVVLTPRGEVLRAADGAVLASGLAQELWFNAPLVDGDTAWWVGGRHYPRGGFRAEARAVQLTRSGEGVTARQRSSTPLDSPERFYAGPVVFGDRLLAVDNVGTLFVLQRETGALVEQRSLGLKGQIWASPIVAGDQLWLQNIDGSMIVLGADLSQVALHPGAGKTLAGVWMAGERIWVRTHTALLAL